MSEPVLLAGTFVCPERVRIWAVARYPNWNWIFLSEDYTKLKHWRASLGDLFTYLPIKQELELSAQRFKKPYMRWLAELGHNHPDSAWWASRISERNTAISPLFEDVCRLDAVRNMLQRSDRPTLILSDNSAILDTLNNAEWLSVAHRFWPVCARIPAGLTIGLIKNFVVNSRLAIPILFLARMAQLLRQVVYAKLAGSSPLPVGVANVVLLHTYLDESAFLPDYKYHDSYFPGLATVLENEGYRVLVLPVMFNVKRSLKSAWSWAKLSSTNFINPYRLYRFIDYVFAFRVAYRATKLPLGALRFEGNDLTRLFRNESARTSFDVLLQILYLRLPLRLSQNGVHCLALLAEFENMIPEKMLIQGFRAYQANAELIGFQHGALYPYLLCNFTPPEERDIAPMYDRVVCNGKVFKDVLISEGLAPELVVVGAALRYKHLWEQFVLPPSKRKAPSIDIFVPLPLMLSPSVELLDKIINAFSGNPKVQVLLKPHPMSSIDELLCAADISELPAHFSITNDAMGTILQHTRLMVGLSTSTMLEAVAAGVPVIRVRRETTLDLDPLTIFGDISPVVCSATELLHEAQRLLTISDAERENLYVKGREILAVSFHPCNEDGFKAFLPTYKVSNVCPDA